MKKKLLTVLFGASLVLAACGGGGDTGGGDGGTDTASVDPETIYKQKCSSCHGGNLEGGAGPGLAGIGSKFSQEEIENIIANGQGTMPPKIIQGEEATAVSEWLASNQ
ncbi:cytochrome c551 [Bacillus sp. B15-48]|uniref:cytochrome c551 n=1 Tax=Bacillus sp. B15-48 TaxID=1548601 RepID=UPI00193ECDF5|nr:cytochrome c [Bacillus sp. B15-48]MBM4760872.1 c-type cytochrome [Bacillus sp. B15-48]